ncbi:MAG: glycosyltransferase [Cytophagaceae bacterium]|nr:glycosyltransferase [Gemmatimonadaceae bacterium]
MRLLVVHQNFPGQFGHLVREWSGRSGWEVRGLGRETAPGLPGFEGLSRYGLHRQGAAAQHPYLRQMEAATLHGQAVAREMLRLRDRGFVPDVILAHPGWGETLYARDVYPDARLVHYCEWYYQADGADLGFDPEFPITFDDRARIRTWNALHALNLTQCDAAVTPTQWQKDRHPAAFHPKITVRHEGIATEGLTPDPAATVTTKSGLTLRAGDPVVTYVARNLEPYRGFHVFMRALAAIQRANRQCHAVIVGGDEVSYGRSPGPGTNWREFMLRSVELDPARTHFLGRVPREVYIRVLQVSAAHVYLTYPFVLSWSLLEAMSCGAPIVASNTAPVREVIDDASMARLVDFFDVQELAAATLETLGDPVAARAMGEIGRRSVQRFSRGEALPCYDELLTPHGSGPNALR